MQAIQWIEARDRAAHRSVRELAMFEALETVHLACCNQVPPIRGRDVNAAFLSSEFGAAIEEETMGRSYIDVDGAVVEYLFRDPSRNYVYRPPRRGEALGPDELQVSENAPDGAATRTIHAMALQFLESDAGHYGGHGHYGDDLRAIQGLIDRYLSAWSGRDGRAVAGLYADNATMLDSLLGVRLTGRDAIGSYAAEHGGVQLRQDFVPRGGGPALYGYWSQRGELTAYLTYVGDDGNGCPGAVTTQLLLARGRIFAERRYHDVASMRRCVDARELPDGWWTHAVIPDPGVDRLTGTVTVEGQRIEIHNATPEAKDLVRWAITRFPAAHLAAPRVLSIAFTEEAHRAQCAGDLRGLALVVGQSSRIYLCYVDDGTAPPFARELILHELGHAWMWQNLTASTQQNVLARLQLPTWDGTVVPREKRGIEQAADLIVWGLTTEPPKGGLLGGRSCTFLAEAFHVLTGAAPLQPACPPGQ